MDELRWAVLGTGVIANEMAMTLGKMGKKLYGVANRTYEKAVTFGQKYGVEKVYDCIDDLWTDPNVDIIYLTTPHNTHYPFMKRALENGKHLLVEKSITLNSQELSEMVQLAASKRLVVAEAMTIWHMPLCKELWRRAHAGDFGRVQMITLNFGSFKPYDMNNRFFNRNLAGGALLDIGVYALSFARSFMDTCPTKIQSQMLPCATGVDEQATILLQNDVGQMATIALSLHSKQPKRAMVSFDRGYLEIMEYPRGDKAIWVDANTGKMEEITAGAREHALYYEMMDMEEAVRSGVSSRMLLPYTQDVMAIMTHLRAEWGLTYPEEVAQTSE